MNKSKTFAIIFAILLLLTLNPFFTVVEKVKGDAIPPIITINFAGNLSDSGGPYWRPPKESDILDEAGEGIFRDGYYTNDSRQSEDWIYINISVNGTGTEPDNVTLHWYNQSSGWTNDSYFFTKGGSTGNDNESYYTFNSSGVISVAEGNNYSFDILANDTAGNVKNVWWNKTAIVGLKLRRYVQLNCTPQSIEYTPFYYYDEVYNSVDTEKEDRLHHDQGADGTINDTGYLLGSTPTDVVQLRRCLSYVGYWFDENICPSGTFETIYWHSWWSSDTGKLSEDAGNSVEHGVFWYKSRGYVTYENEYDGFNTNASLSVSSITYDNGDANYNNSYNLCCKYLDVTNLDFTDNNIFEIYILFWEYYGHVSVISNRSFTSFIIPDIPSDIWDGTDNATDTDSDGLSDHMELNTTYGTCTNPFLADTDNDGVSDYHEYLSFSDPNNYTDTTPYAGSNTAPALSSEIPNNASVDVSRYPQLNITVIDADGNNSNVYLYTNDTGHWYLMQTNSSVLNETVRLMTFTNASAFSTTYYWKVSANDTHDNTTEIYHFTTVAANTNPLNSAPSPADGATGIDLNPTLQITVSDPDGHIMNQTFRTNASGNWNDISWNNNTGNDSLSSITSVFGSYSTKYWWSSNVSDGNDGWDNDTYSFTAVAGDGNGGGGGGGGDNDNNGATPPIVTEPMVTNTIIWTIIGILIVSGFFVLYWFKKKKDR